MDVIAADFRAGHRILKWKFKRNFNHRKMGRAFGDIGLHHNLQVSSRLHEGRNRVGHAQHACGFDRVADGQFEVFPDGLLRGSQHAAQNAIERPANVTFRAITLKGSVPATNGNATNGNNSRDRHS